jgi:oligopeptidase A
MSDASTNPLLALGDPIRFADVRAEHVVPAFDTLLAEAQAAVEAIAAQTAPLDHASVLGALEKATERLERAHLVTEHLESVATTPELRAAWNEAQPKLSEFHSKLPLHEGLYRVLSAYAATDEARGLDAVRARHLAKTLEEFERHGAKLSPEGKAALTEIDVELAKLTTKFSQNVLDATNLFELVVTDEARLAGLPASALAAAKQSAERKGVEGFRFTLHAPSFIPAITYLDDRDLRRQLYEAYNRRATEGEHDNRPLITRILELRKRKAELLGFADFSDFTTADRMAKKGARAQSFVDDLRDRTKPAFEREKAELRSFAGVELEAFDVPYYAEKLKRARFDLDDEALRPYFPLERVLSGLFEILGRLFAVRFEHADLPTWNQAVRPFHLVDADGTRLASIYVDLFPREDKVQGAWMAPLRTATPPEPHVAVVAANFTPPVGDAPALLTHREVETLFHELGHLMHQCLSRVPVRRLGGTNVAWDFVELPSQIMENWTWEREALDLVAAHHATGERVPDELFEKLLRARTYRAASAQMQQLGYAEVDLDLHRRFDPSSGEDPIARARAVLAEHVTARLPEGFAMIASFGHLFASPVGYAAGYYSYKWAEVLDADAFGRFRDEGLFSAEVGRAFRAEILERGDSEDPEVLYERFRGRAPTVDALLARLGLTA